MIRPITHPGLQADISVGLNIWSPQLESMAFFIWVHPHASCSLLSVFFLFFTFMAKNSRSWARSTSYRWVICGEASKLCIFLALFLLSLCLWQPDYDCTWTRLPVCRTARWSDCSPACWVAREVIPQQVDCVVIGSGDFRSVLHKCCTFISSNNKTVAMTASNCREPI